VVLLAVGGFGIAAAILIGRRQPAAAATYPDWRKFAPAFVTGTGRGAAFSVTPFGPRTKPTP
jgi:hypothetical protein